MSHTIQKNKINFTSLGCPRNLVDSEVMLGILLKEGYEITEYVEDADYLVINTCSFLEAARQESKEAIEELLDAKKSDAKLIVTGCMVSKHKDQIEKMFPGVHYLLGSGDVEGILEAVKSDSKGSDVGSVRSYLESGEVPRTISTGGYYSYLKIAEGCRKACSYCSIPKIKGPLRSKPANQVIKEFRALLSQGVREVILIAQDLGDYGKDIGITFSGLLSELIKVEGDYWLRLLYLYPDEIDDKLIEIMKSDKRICPYLDIPIQHINDDILKSMRRSTSQKEIKDIISRLRSEIPGIHIRTSLIVGFPGETDEQFEELLGFVQEYPLNHVGFFKYSLEDGTGAAKMQNQISEDIKEKRLNRLSEVQQKVLKKLNSLMVGKRVEVVIEGYHPETDLLMVGRYNGQAPEIDGQIIINDHSLVSEFNKRYLVEITDADGYDFVGRVIKQINYSKKQKSKLNLVS